MLPSCENSRLKFTFKVLMRVLVVTTLYPGTVGKDVQGAYRRLRVAIGAISKIAEELEILCFVLPDCPALKLTQQQLDEEQTEFWGTPVRVTLALRRPYLNRRWWHRLLAVLWYSSSAVPFEFGGSEQVEALKKCLGRRPHIVFVHKLASIAPIVSLRRSLPHLVFDLDDVEHLVAIRSALASRSWFSKIIGLAKVPGIFLAERMAAKRCARLFVCSDRDRRHLQRLGFGDHVTVMPNAISIPIASSIPPTAQTILFLGMLSYWPNTEAAERLIDRIWPSIQKVCPSAKLIIAGRSPESLRSYRLAPPNVEFTGLVDDLDALYARTRLICCPLTTGGGTRIKLIEAAAYAKPIVSTLIGAEGLAFVDGSEILIRNDDEGIAEACARLLYDDALCSFIGEAARRKAQLMYDITVVQHQIASEILSSFGSINS
jgi:glycosyltransferase involved in cell wall biosynthesis